MLIATRLCLGLLAGAALLSAQTPDAAPDSKTRVNVYRYKQYAGKGIRPSIYCDEKEMARIQSGRYFVVLAAPGKHVFRSNDKQSQIELDLKPGQEYYIRVEIATGFWKGHGRLTLVMPEQGSGELKQLKPVDKDMIVDHDLVVAGDVAGK